MHMIDEHYELFIYNCYLLSSNGFRNINMYKSIMI